MTHDELQSVGKGIASSDESDQSEWTTLIEAKRKVLAELDGGVSCPCCGQFAKIYRRTITSQMAKGLIRFYRAASGAVGLPIVLADLFDHDRLYAVSAGKGGDFTKLVYWGLISEVPKPDTKDTRSSGVWQLTEKGQRFVLCAEKVPKNAVVYDGQLIGLEGRMVSIRECLRSRFSYDELMSA